MANETAWWRDAVMYEVYLRSFADGNGDGIGDLPGLCERLPYLRDLGIDGIWITPWFRAAMEAGPGSPERDRYHFRDGTGDDGEQPPNDWISAFGGRAWTRVRTTDGSPGQWYLHLF